MIKHTAAYSPWANGINERNHATVDVMMEKMLEDQDTTKITEKMALNYAVAIRNTCMYINGFTPAQLVFGQSPRLPSNFTADLPALENVTTSPVIADHLNALAGARKAFATASNSAKLKKALLKPVRSYCDLTYQQGDKVLYKSYQWTIDGKVLPQ